MLVISGGVWLSVAERQSENDFIIDVCLGIPCVALVYFRRRWPFAIAVVTTLLSAGSSLAAGPATLAAFSLATRRKWLQIAAVGVLSLASAHLFQWVQPSDPEPGWVMLITNVVFISAILAWGMYVGSRRELLWALRARAERAEAEQELRVAQARGNERGRIAREMHDVLAHRISRISMHAGALAFRDDLEADEMRSSAQVIERAAHEALADLRGVLGVLRDDRTGDPVSLPQPTYADVPELIDEARATGLPVHFSDHVSGAEPMPEVVGRTLYRILQEGMTNVRKHAPGALLTVELRGSAEDGVEFTLRNRVGFGRSIAPGAGVGLIGLAERVAVRGGRLQHHRDGQDFVLQGWIPWTP